MQNINTNVRPYYDDFTGNSNYYRILFNPGRPVQARELTQIQSAIQNQIEQVGKHLFVNGAKILDANQFFESNLYCLRLENTYNALNVNLTNLLGKRVIGQTSSSIGIVKEIIDYIDINNPKKIIIQLVSGSGFVPTEEVWTDEVSPYKATIKANGAQDAITESLRYSISSGIFFINGFFVWTAAQSIVLDSNTNTSSHSVGFDIEESFISADTDPNLLDPANGTSNYAAPGADRLSITLTLTRLDLNTSKDNYIEIARIESGRLTFEVTKTVYAEIEKELARRTFDESGNYTVNPFHLTLIDHFTAAKATVNITSGVVTSITPSNTTGIKFTATPTITINGDGTGATATVNLDNNPLNATYQEIISITVNTGGSGYTSATASISGDPNKFMCQLDAGKAYVKGYEFTTISPSYIETTKPRTTDQADNIDINVNYANLLYVTNINTLFNPNILQPVDLHKVVRNTSSSNTKIGTARIRMQKLVSGIPGSGTETYKLSLFNISLDQKPLLSVVWSLGIATFNSPAHGFVAGQRIIIKDRNYEGVYTVLSSPAVATDYFSIAKADNPGSLNAAAYAQNLIEDLESVTSQGTQNGANVSLLSKVGGVITADAFISGTDSNSLLFPLNNTWAKTIRDSLGNPQSDYTYQSVYNSINFSAGQATISTLNGLERFFGAAGALGDTLKDQYYYAIVTDPGTSAFLLGQVVRFDNGTGRSITLSTPSVGVSQQATFDVNANVSFVANILATINANTQTEKTKSLQNYTYLIIASPNTTVGVVDSLGIADIKNLKYVYNTRNINPTGQIALNGTTGEITNWGIVSTHNDVTNSYKLDNGQRDTIYDHGGIILQNSFTTLNTDYLVVVFNYYNHTGSGFLSVDSYSEPYDQIPSYISPTTGIKFNLRDCIDFRPKRDNNLTTFSNVKFPDADFTFNCDYQYYIPRVDRIFALSEKAFSLTKGVPNLYPVPPAVGGDESMLLYTLIIPPYLIDLSDITVYYHDNKRYTMEDIGDLENRIKHLEYYASLTLLEQQARSISITDKNNFEKFKNGFFVDPFVGHFIGAIGDYNYRCSIDSEKQELRAFCETNQLDFNITNNSNTVQGGDKLTLSFTETPFISQTKSSSSMSVNPYNIVTYVGDLTPIPATDSWTETQILPDVVNTVNITNPQTVVVNAFKESTIDKITNIIKSTPTPSDAQRQYLANSEKSGLTSWVYNPAAQTVASNTGQVINNVNATVVNNFLGRK